jgi:hypothetical protein
MVTRSIVASVVALRHKKAIATIGVLLSAVMVVSSSLLAQAAEPTKAQSGAGRFTMHPADGGFLRLDTQTGQMSLCKSSGSTAGCTTLPDERLALEQQNDALKRENQDLKTSVRRLEELAGIAPGETTKPDGQSRPGAQLPTEEDVDKAMSYVQRMLKKFKEKIREFEDLDKKGTNL